MTGQPIPLVAFVVAFGVLLHYLPWWRRQQLWFGVTVPPRFSDTGQARAGLGRYRLIVWLSTAVAAASFVAGSRLEWPWLGAAGMAAQTAGALAAFALVRRRLLPFGTREAHVRSAAISVVRETLPGGVWSVLVPLGVLGAAALYLQIDWDRIPDPLPVHWNASGIPDRWAARTPTVVFGPLIVCGVFVLFMFGVAQAILHRSPRGRVAGTESWTRRFRQATLRMLVAGIWGMSAIAAYIAAAPLLADPTSPALGWAVPAIVLVAIVPFAIQLVRLTQDEASGTDGTPDECWKLGLIYYNPADPAVLVEKRFGVGYTVNFASRTLWGMIAAGALLVWLTALLL